MKFAAIDIGTNAVRLLLSRVFENGEGALFKKESLVRIPLRLGEEVFTNSRISPEKTVALIKTISGFRYLIEAYQALDYWACATSAMRDAVNGQEVVEAIRNECGVELEIIDGRREAEIICSNHPLRFPDPNRAYLFIDVGGGSTELTLWADNRIIASRSVDIGGIRILKNLVTESQWLEMKDWIKSNTRKYRPLTAVGTGGNINKIFRLSGKGEEELLSYKKLKSIHEYLNGFTLEERIRTLQLRPDRADVIIPAAEIYLAVMKWARVKDMLVPLAGLPDGMVRILYQKYRNRFSENPIY